MASAVSSDMAKIMQKFKNLNKIANKFDRLRKKVSKTPKTLEDVKPRLHETVKFLNSGSDFSSKETGDALEYLAELSEINNKTLCKEIGTYLAEQNFGALFKKIATDLQKCRRNSQSGAEQQWMYNLIILESAYANYAYECQELGREFGQQNGAQLMFQDLEEMKHSLNDSTWACDIATAILGVLHSCFYANSENREIYKAAKAVDILTVCVQSNDVAVKTTSLLLLLYVAEGLSDEIVEENQECIGHLTQLLKLAVDSKDHIVDVGNSRLSARELLNCLNHMAVNDENREEIQKHGGVVTMNRMLQPDFSEEEQKVGAEGLWNLAFVESVRNKPYVKDITQSLKSLKKSANKALREASTYALWEIEDRFRDLSKSRHRTDDSGIQPEKPVSKSTVRHVMISYQWSSQKRALEIRDELVKAGYKVWMDVDKMNLLETLHLNPETPNLSTSHNPPADEETSWVSKLFGKQNSLEGNILTAMADAVEKAAVVVVCITRKYKESLNCRSEASYAYKHAKPIVPVLLEEGYKPDGWLGLFVGMQLYYELFSDDAIKKNMSALIRDIGERGCGVAVDSTKTRCNSIVSGVPDTVGTGPEENQTSKINILDWSTQRVQEWFKENDLSELCSILHFCDGKHLQDMYKRYSQSPDSFRNDLKSDLKLSFTTSVKFTAALDNLFKV